MDIKVGTTLKIKNLDAHVIGMIVYENTHDNCKKWTEYRLDTPSGEKWLSIDEEYGEYSISEITLNKRNKSLQRWKKVDSGHQVVVKARGDVDVSFGDAADFIEYEDESEENIYSVEKWDDGEEYSNGRYINIEDIIVTGFKKVPIRIDTIINLSYCLFILGLLFFMIISSSISNLPKKIRPFLKSSNEFEYVSSVTGKGREKADVYKYKGDGYINTTDYVAERIINGIEGQTESVTQQDDKDDGDIAIVTKREYCLIYHPEDAPKEVYVQISNRKYNYSSDNAPYKGSNRTTHWYRSHYYSSSYSSDSKKYSGTHSSYESYDGETIGNIGNGKYDSYSKSVRQASINSRESSGGGLGGGK